MNFLSFLFNVKLFRRLARASPLTRTIFSFLVFARFEKGEETKIFVEAKRGEEFRSLGTIFSKCIHNRNNF